MPENLWYYIPSQSPWNMPVPKLGTKDYPPVQDLRLVNQATETLHPMVPNSYMLSGLAPESQKLFAFQWENPETVTTQDTWIQLPQGFKNSPTIFGEALARDLQKLSAKSLGCMLIQYVDDLLLGYSTAIRCAKGTDALLWDLEVCGYKVSKKKAQICRQQGQYLGSTVRQGKCSLGAERKWVICKLPEPKTTRQVKEFLKALGFCRLWISYFAVLAKPLYEVTKRGDKEPLERGNQQQQPFHTLKRKLTSASALGLPDLTKPFTLYVPEKEKMAVGMLTQNAGSLPLETAGWSFRGLASMPKGPSINCLLAQEADKLTLGQNLNIKALHAVVTLMNTKGHHRLSNARLTKYQSLLCENPHITFEVCNTLNPATLLQTSENPVKHDCIEVPELQDQPWTTANWELYVDGSSFINSLGQRCAGYAVVTLDTVVEAKSLPQGTPA
ncbi:hypothetical protein AAY473_017667 [Plecturocebus cupreus]